MLRSIAIALVVLPSFAHARPTITAGAGVGIIESAVDSNNGVGPSSMLGVYGRIRATSRLAFELEVDKLQGPDTSIDFKRGSVMLVVDLASNPRWVPILFGGAGIDVAKQYGGETDGHHFEGGFGFEFRSRGGLTVGVDLRMGGRAIDNNPPQPVLLTGIACCGAVPTMSSGDYRSARLTIGASF